MKGLYRLVRFHGAFVATVICMITLGVASMTATLELAKDSIWGSIHVEKPENLLLVRWEGDAPKLKTIFGGAIGYDPHAVISSAAYHNISENCHTCSAVIGAAPLGVGPGTAAVEIGNETYNVTGEIVSDNYFSALGLHPSGGTLALKASRNATPQIVISQHLYEECCKERHAIRDLKVSVDGQPFVVRGVVAGEFNGIIAGRHPDVWTLIDESKQCESCEVASPPWWITTLIRTQGGDKDAKVLTAEINTLFRRTLGASGNISEAIQPPNITLTSGKNGLSNALNLSIGNYVTGLLRIAMAIALLLMVNLAVLTLVRLRRMSGDYTVRLAMGSTRGQLTWLVLGDLVVCMCVSIVLAIPFKIWISRVLAGLLSTMVKSTGLKLAVPAFQGNTVPVMVLFAAVIVGIACVPACLWVRRLAPGKTIEVSSMRHSRRATVAFRVLVSTQIGVCFLVTLYSAVWIHQFRALSHDDLGFDPNGLDYYEGQVPGNTPMTAAKQMFGRISDLIEEAKGLEGVKGVAAASTVPMAGWEVSLPVKAEGAAVPRVINTTLITPSYFNVMRTIVINGDPSRIDEGSSLVVNQALADQLRLPGGALGKTVTFAGDPFRIVAVVQNVKYDSVKEPATPRLYASLKKFSAMALHLPGGYTLHLRYSGEGAAPRMALKRMIATSGIPWASTISATSAEQSIYDSTLREHVMASLGKIFACVALGLCVLSIYSTTAYAVAQRGHEIAIRTALGASRKANAALFQKEALIGAVSGSSVGIALALLGWKVLLPGIRMSTASVTAVCALCTMMFASVSMVAAFLPALRILHEEPANVLKAGDHI